jgi:hypothetical protein
MAADSRSTSAPCQELLFECLWMRLPHSIGWHAHYERTALPGLPTSLSLSVFAADGRHDPPQDFKNHCG